MVDIDVSPFAKRADAHGDRRQLKDMEKTGFRGAERIGNAGVLPSARHCRSGGGIGPERRFRIVAAVADWSGRNAPRAERISNVSRPKELPASESPDRQSGPLHIKQISDFNLR